MERINTHYTENNELKSKAKLLKPFNHDVATRPKPPPTPTPSHWTFLHRSRDKQKNIRTSIGQSQPYKPSGYPTFVQDFCLRTSNAEVSVDRIISVKEVIHLTDPLVSDV